jgi:ureidoglycolate lyase
MPRTPLSIEPLRAETFSEYGSVIDKTGPSVSVNQGTATKFLDVVKPQNLYSLAPSKKWAKAVVNLFSCSPRSIKLLDHDTSIFPVTILERHPFTSQTFVPIGLSPDAPSSPKYLVIVAPSLPARESRKRVPRPPSFPTPEPRQRRTFKELLTQARPPPFPENTENNKDQNKNSRGKGTPNPSRPRLPGSGLPDLNNVKAFLADGSQGVTYGPGTWHSPMVVLGDQAVDFLVLQYANGVANEDCQEWDIGARTKHDDEEDLLVSVPVELGMGVGLRARL